MYLFNLTDVVEQPYLQHAKIIFWDTTEQAHFKVLQKSLAIWLLWRYVRVSGISKKNFKIMLLFDQLLQKFLFLSVTASIFYCWDKK